MIQEIVEQLVDFLFLLFAFGFELCFLGLLIFVVLLHEKELIALLLEFALIAQDLFFPVVELFGQLLELLLLGFEVAFVLRDQEHLQLNVGVELNDFLLGLLELLLQLIQLQPVFLLDLLEGRVVLRGAGEIVLEFLLQLLDL